MRLEVPIWTMLSVTPLAFAGAMATSASAQSTVDCPGTLSQGTYADVIVDGAACTIGDGVTVNGAVIGMSRFGTLQICGDAEVRGGIKVTQGNGAVIVGGSAPACSASEIPTIEGTVLVEKGRGPVSLLELNAVGVDFIVTEQRGNIEALGVSLSDVKIEKSRGNIKLNDVTTDSDTTIVENRGGSVEILLSRISGDLELKLNRRVSIIGSSFLFEDVFVGNNRRVDIVGNTDLNITVVENSRRVTIEGNTFTEATVDKNTGGVRINGNTGEVLSCADNNPAPTGSNNTITELADGQCNAF